MAKPKKSSFTEEFEHLILNCWGSYDNTLNPSLLKRTQKAAIDIRKIYRFKQKLPSRLQYRSAKNRAGYLAAFGQRHSLLTYCHLASVKRLKPEVVPEPKNRSLTITLIGAGAAIEVYGLCLFYNEDTQRISRLHINSIEKIDEWSPTRQQVLSRFIKNKFPRLNLYPKEIKADITKEDCIQKFAFEHDALIDTDILMIYNVMNEIETRHASIVFRNLNYILRQCQKNLLILVMEPSAKKARPRVRWLIERLAECSEVIAYQEAQRITFDEEPFRIDYEQTGEGLNDRLYASGGPKLQKSLIRISMACRIKPLSPISIEIIEEQLRILNVRRNKGRFIKSKSIDEAPYLPGLLDQQQPS